MVAGYTAGGESFTPGKPQAWPELTSSPIGTNFHAAVLLPEGGEKQKPIAHLTLLENFFDELRRKAPMK